MHRTLLLVCLIGCFSTSFTGKKLKVPKAFVYIPSGVYQDGQQNHSLQGFYMMSSEVSNLDYREFLYYLKNNQQEETYEKARFHTENWKIDQSLIDNYHNSPAFEDYPAVNITQEGARLYCDWLTKILQDKYPDMLVKARLPTEKEWMYAASGGHSDRPYPNGYYLRNQKGELLYSYKIIGDEAIHQSSSSGEIEVKNTDFVVNTDFRLPMPAKSNTPNDFGLYNTCGNVAEMLHEEGHTKGGSYMDTGYDIRIDAPDVHAGFKEASPLIGFRVLLSIRAK
jgi:formylglycine-generating enzyme required for sulfatase activity